MYLQAFLHTADGELFHLKHADVGAEGPAPCYPSIGREAQAKTTHRRLQEKGHVENQMVTLRTFSHVVSLQGVPILLSQRWYGHLPDTKKFLQGDGLQLFCSSESILCQSMYASNLLTDYAR